MANGDRFVGSQNFINAANIASVATAILAPFLGAYLLYEIQRSNDRYDAIVQMESKIETQIAVMAETQSAQAGQLASNNIQIRQLSDLINQTRDRVLCLEKKSICHD